MVLVHRAGTKIIELPRADLSNRNKTALRKMLLPPVNKFNTGYLKGRDNDPL